MNIFEAVDHATTVFRKGEVVQTQKVGSVQVTEVFGYPHTSEAVGLTIYDLVFVDVGVDSAKAAEVKADLMSWLDWYPYRSRLLDGPSYIELAGNGEVEQETALRIFALMENLGLGQIMTLRDLIPDAPKEQVRELAGSGMLYCVPSPELEEALR